MSTQKHTPGPWVVVPQSDGSAMIAHEFETGKQMNPKGLRLIAHVLARRNSLAEDEANARLIDAAPDMYEALRSAPLPSTLGNVKTHYGEFYRWYDKVCKPAIARAEGRTP